VSEGCRGADEDAGLGPAWVQDPHCECWVVTIEVDGQRRDAHHWLPDDSAPHVPDPECGCGPHLLDNPDGVLLYEHVDQDD
jgi:hypothetical protein